MPWDCSMIEMTLIRPASAFHAATSTSLLHIFFGHRRRLTMPDVIGYSCSEPSRVRISRLQRYLYPKSDTTWSHTICRILRGGYNSTGENQSLLYGHSGVNIVVSKYSQTPLYNFSSLSRYPWPWYSHYDFLDSFTRISCLNEQLWLIIYA